MFGKQGLWLSAVSSPSGVWGRAPAENAFWFIYQSENASCNNKFPTFLEKAFEPFGSLSQDQE